jgi:hypothetical protein
MYVQLLHSPDSTVSVVTTLGHRQSRVGILAAAHFFPLQNIQIRSEAHQAYDRMGSVFYCWWGKVAGA